MDHNSATYTIPVYRLQLVQEGRVETTTVTGPADLAFHLKEIATENDSARIWIHPERAKALRIADGDCMTLTSSVGKGRARARVPPYLSAEATERWTGPSAG